MSVVGIANLAVKVADLDEAIAFYERSGATVRDRQMWRNGERADVMLGALALTLFTKAIYEDDVALPAEGFLHVATFTDDLDAEIEGHDVVWGPEVVSGAFGTRRIVFVDAPGNMRLEFMEQLAPPAASDDLALRRSLLDLGTATLGESGAGVVQSALRPAWNGARVAGPCVPVACAAGDNLAIHAAVADAPAGSVLCVVVDGEPERGYWGEVLTVAAQSRGVVGLVIEACVRDTVGLQRRSFPVFCTGKALPGATKAGPGQVGESIVLGGRTVAAGDWVVADADGVVVLVAGELDGVHRRARAREQAEAEMFDRLAHGATTVDLLGLDTSPVRRPT